MTVIHSDFGDTDTKVLRDIWRGLSVKEVHLTRYSNKLDMRRAKDAIKAERDLVIFCGHGDRRGCWSPSYTGGSYYTIGPSDLSLLRGKKVVGIWCHASSFSKRYKVEGFFSSMFISNTVEAAGEGIRGVSNADITASEMKFCGILNKLLKEKVPLSEWKEHVDAAIDETNPVEVFNYSQVFYNPGVKEDSKEA